MYRATNKPDSFLILSIASALTLASCCERPDAEHSRSEQAPEPKIVVGATLPEFVMTSLEEPAVTYTRDSLVGTVYLIDFWATWCLPCVAELPNLHEAYEEYSERGFEILSVAVGDDRQEIVRLRETEWPMPWRHAFEELDGEAAQQFEIFSVPRAILADSTGTIVGIDQDVRGEKLRDMLARLLPDGQ